MTGLCIRTLMAALLGTRLTFDMKDTYLEVRERIGDCASFFRDREPAFCLTQVVERNFE
jgi:hypothetical protein